MPKKPSEAKKNVYLDSDIIVAAEIPTDIHHSDSQDFMKQVTENKNPDFVFFTSVFTSLELASAMIRRTKDKDKVYSLLYRIKKTWKNSINPLPPMPPKEMTSFTRLIDSLVETTIIFNTPSGDTIHAQTAASWEMHYFVTWNKPHFMNLKRQLGDIKVLDPHEMLNEFKANLKVANGAITMVPVKFPSPINIKPILGAIGVNINPIFNWSIAPSAIRYEFEIAEEVGQADKFSLKDEAGSGKFNFFRLINNLKYDTKYWWRVRATNSAGVKTSWMTSFFKTKTRPTVKSGI